MWFKKLNYIWFKMPERRKSYFVANPYIGFQWLWLHKGQAPCVYHWVMFRTAVDVCANDEQKAKWMPLIDGMDIIGCYGQTELGHGSDVQGLKTTATFDIEKQEFVIHTPSIDATKWWPGDMGRTANHALIVARIQIPDPEGDIDDYGLGMFLVQVRDRDTHRWMPGITSGEIGPKFGYTSKDNGWMNFNQVRIKKENMLQKFMNVDEDGCFELKSDPRALYLVMLRTRILLFGASWVAQNMVSQIGIRYSIVRRQFRNITGQEGETKLMDYQTQQMKLFPILAGAYIHGAGTDYVSVLYLQLIKEIEKGDFKLLDILNHLSAGMKGLYT